LQSSSQQDANSPKTIDDVIARLDQVIEHCSRTHSKLGYFAVLYRDVTVQVRQAIAAGRFEDGPRMERLDVIFANRYLDALDCHWRRDKLTHSWETAFKAAHTRPPIILQHLLLGMSAHINLDLAIAAAQTAPGDALPGLKRDFYEITLLLDEMIDSVQERIDQVSPWFRFIDRVGGRTEEKICAFAMGEARDLAWRAAEKLAVMTPEEFEREVARHDAIVAELGQGIRSPGGLLGAGLRLIRLRERHPVHLVIETLRL
jgi:hypothetical protein